MATQAEIAARRRQVAALLLSGASSADIRGSGKYGASPGTLRTDIDAVQRQWLDEIEDLRLSRAKCIARAAMVFRVAMGRSEAASPQNTAMLLRVAREANADIATWQGFGTSPAHGPALDMGTVDATILAEVEYLLQAPMDDPAIVEIDAEPGDAHPA